MYTHHVAPPGRCSVSPARARRRTSSRSRSRKVGLSPSLESLLKGMGSVKRTPRRLARLRHTNVNPAVDSDFSRSTTALSIVRPWLLCIVSTSTKPEVLGDVSRGRCRNPWCSRTSRRARWVRTLGSAGHWTKQAQYNFSNARLRNQEDQKFSLLAPTLCR